MVERTLTAISGVDQMQIVQEAIGKFSLKVVPGEGDSRQAEAALENEIRSVFGREVQVQVDWVKSIPQENSGKYRFSICKVAY